VLNEEQMKLIRKACQYTTKERLINMVKPPPQYVNQVRQHGSSGHNRTKGSPESRLL
jgi:hypothetical protein